MSYPPDDTAQNLCSHPDTPVEVIADTQSKIKDLVEEFRHDVAIRMATQFGVPLEVILEDPAMSYHNVLLVMMDPPADTVFEDIGKGIQGVLNDAPADPLA